MDTTNREELDTGDDSTNTSIYQSWPGEEDVCTDTDTNSNVPHYPSLEPHQNQK